MDIKFDKNIIKVIVGLGNPGGTYAKTRHNIGFQVVDYLAQQYGGQWKKTELMEIAQVRLTQDPFDSLSQLVYLVKPLTYMNKSGEIVPYFQKKGVTAEQYLLIHDELEKPFGAVVVKKGGSAKGHNGLRSFIERIGQDFWRLRVGIGRPAEKSEVGNFVLSDFTKDETVKIPTIIQEAAAFMSR